MRTFFALILFLLVYTLFAQNSNLNYTDPTIGSVGVILEPTRPIVHLPNSMVRVFPIRKDQLDDQISNFHLTITSHRLNKVFAFMPVSGAVNNDIWNKRYEYRHETLKPYYYCTRFADRMYFTENNAFTYNWYAKHDFHGFLMMTY